MKGKLRLKNISSFLCIKHQWCKLCHIIGWIIIEANGWPVVLIYNSGRIFRGSFKSSIKSSWGRIMCWQLQQNKTQQIPSSSKQVCNWIVMSFSNTEAHIEYGEILVAFTFNKHRMSFQGCMISHNEMLALCFIIISKLMKLL